MVLESSLNRSDPFHIRLAIADAFTALAPVFTPDNVVPFFKFLVDAEALGDRGPTVRRAMLDAGAAVIDAQGSSRLGELIAIFEGCLSKPSVSETSDHISEAVVIVSNIPIYVASSREC